MVTGHIISTSSWRDGQKLIKQILGPAPKVEKEAKSQSNDRQAAKRSVSKERNSDQRTVPSERQKEKGSKSSDRLGQTKAPSKEAPREDVDRLLKPGSSLSRSDSRHAQKSSRSQMDAANKNKTPLSMEEEKHQDVSAEVKKDFLPLEIQGILDDLQLGSGLDHAKQSQKRGHSPTKRKSEKGQVSEEVQMSSKRRHYDSEQVRLYIMRQQEERKKKQNEQRAAQRQAEEQKNKRLQELYQKQREAFSKAKNVTNAQKEKETQESVSNKSFDTNFLRPQDTYSKLLLSETWPRQTEQETQREADKYPPLASNVRSDFQGPWEELTKGSPHSVINIFTRTFQHHGKDRNGYEEHEPDHQPVLSAGSPQDSLSYADDFISIPC
ncbi:unnamed protein product [Ranitomeya imitator]|uniref:Uncharacterized protein n=1 Tax=Ranitomeya imitator TaxID=111125 RepID=A0ABN9KSI1_9NEOB|nr:unnamed protein product [Ranitomeya imitator]